MRKPQGYSTWTDRLTGLVLKECDSFTCTRCSHVTNIPPFSSPTEYGGLCAKTGKMICKRCVKKDDADRRTWDEKIDKLADEIEKARFSGGVSVERMNEILG